VTLICDILDLQVPDTVDLFEMRSLGLLDLSQDEIHGSHVDGLSRVRADFYPTFANLIEQMEDLIVDRKDLLTLVDCQ